MHQIHPKLTLVCPVSDLQSLQAEHSSACTGTQRRTILPGNKRYFILTYTSEYDCTHYPLPLSHIECPDPQHLKETISRLHAELRLAQMVSWVLLFLAHAYSVMQKVLRCWIRLRMDLNLQNTYDRLRWHLHTSCRRAKRVARSCSHSSEACTRRTANCRVS